MRGVSTRKNQTKADAPIFSPVKQRGKYLETFLLRHIRSDPLPKKPETMGWEPVSCFPLQILSAVNVQIWLASKGRDEAKKEAHVFE